MAVHLQAVLETAKMELTATSARLIHFRKCLGVMKRKPARFP